MGLLQPESSVCREQLMPPSQGHMLDYTCVFVFAARLFCSKQHSLFFLFWHQNVLIFIRVSGYANLHFFFSFTVLKLATQQIN